MIKIRNMQEREAEQVRDLWLQMCAQAGTPLPDASAQFILAILKQYAAHQLVHCFVAEERLMGTLPWLLHISVQSKPDTKMYNRIRDAKIA